MKPKSKSQAKRFKAMGAPERTPLSTDVLPFKRRIKELEREVAALEQERDELDAHLMETLNQLDDCELGLIDCLKSRSFELRQAEVEVERLRAANEELAADCESNIQREYGWPNVHPAQQTRYDRDMAWLRALTKPEGE